MFTFTFPDTAGHSTTTKSIIKHSKCCNCIFRAYETVTTVQKDTKKSMKKGFLLTQYYQSIMKCVMTCAAKMNRGKTKTKKWHGVNNVEKWYVRISISEGTCSRGLIHNVSIHTRLVSARALPFNGSQLLAKWFLMKQFNDIIWSPISLCHSN